MSKLVLNGDTSGSVTLDAPAVSGTTTLTLPTTSATLITDSSGVLNIGSGQLYKDANGNVGIGTSSPSGAGKTLAVQGTSSGDNYSSIVAGSASNANFVSFYSGQTVDPNPSIIFNNSLRFGTATAPTTAGYTELMRITDAGLLQFNSGYGSVETAYGCRAWVNFNGTGTPAIRASGNVTSITDNGTGNYTVNFTNSMPDANYCFTGANGDISGNGDRTIRPYTYTTTSVAFNTTLSAALNDPINVNVAIFR